MPAEWRAADLAPSEREDSFIDFICASIVPYGDPAGVVVTSRDGISTADVGPLRIMRIGWTGGAAVRAWRQLRQADPELCKIDVSRSGRFSVEQGERQAALDADTFTLVDLSRPHRVAAQRSEITAVLFPRALLPLRDRDIDELAGTTFGRAEPGAALVTSVVREMTDNLDVYEGPTGARLGEALFDLIAATLTGRLDRPAAMPTESRHRALVVQIRRYIEDHLADPDLGPTTIALRHHISPRQLHKLFEDQGTTVAELIRSRRLERCRQDLLDPARSGVPLSAVAARWGFRDPAYFNRVFRAEHGLPPGEYRRAALVRG
jgi:AraC-like DNA-binding protein